MKIDLDSIRLEFCKKDYAVFDLPSSLTANEGSTQENIQDVIAFLTSELKLGEPYIPPIYRMGDHSSYVESSGLNHIGGPAQNSNHPAFSSSERLDLHTDGTLDRIGDIQTSILVCVNPARKGGDSVLFRSAALAEKLLHEGDIDLEPFFSHIALRRHTTILDKVLYADGPVLGWKKKQIVSRYCITPRDKWQFGAVTGLEDARKAFEAYVKNHPSYTSKVRMLSGQVIIMNNNRISHGRTAFNDESSSPRHMIRALFRRSIAT